MPAGSAMTEWVSIDPPDRGEVGHDKIPALSREDREVRRRAAGRDVGSGQWVGVRLFQLNVWQQYRGRRTAK